jgi:ferrous iron transport protein B
MAKESIVSMLSVTFGGMKGIQNVMTPLTALTFLVFSLLYTPCLAAVSAIKKEQGRRFALQTVIFQCVVAYIAAGGVYIIAYALGMR